MKKVYEKPEWKVWSIETDDLEVLKASTEFGGGEVFDPLDNEGPTY